MVGQADVTAWRPTVPGLREVFHARFGDHAYPRHTHDAWTLLIVDEGAVRYDLDRHEHGALGTMVTLLPPDVAHDGRSVRPRGFRKRVLYLDRELIGDELIGRAVDHPDHADPMLRDRIDLLHTTLATRGEPLEAESRLALIVDRLQGRLVLGSGPNRPPAPRPGLAGTLRDLLDARLPDDIGLAEAAARLHAHPVHLVRAFTREIGMPPHRYLIGRRIDLARGYLLAGHGPAEAAALSGFYDQSHLARHLRRMIGVPPRRYARGPA
ncbi:AraC family transcriptional regulator [Prauserella marina]|uniref:AraC-type DNA-binding protein n=1 Tax=Prauserella marina TaxID=530584 RepID=A0A222W0W4_9PSEU|nr:AraC family transcriptional regulator [Prauserella marina]ASR39563.1 AraC family transcriptional regulator [Prauserella marina]PWV74789.1 AraC family transcriptional regulator [Prauserella marina]SDD40649.1 AraC-type DNA-binding protein [Prauserella marina]